MIFLPRPLVLPLFTLRRPQTLIKTRNLQVIFTLFLNHRFPSLSQTAAITEKKLLQDLPYLTTMAITLHSPKLPTSNRAPPANECTLHTPANERTIKNSLVIEQKFNQSFIITFWQPHSFAFNRLLFDSLSYQLPA